LTRKPASMYHRVERPYTRREYMGGVPGSKVVHYDMGNLQEDFPVKLTLVAKEPCQIRHTALEAARVAANRFLLKQMGRNDYHLKLRVYPHHVLNLNDAKVALKRAGHKLPTPTWIVVESGGELTL
jgi:large subunit ribosomal protein L10e